VAGKWTREAHPGLRGGGCRVLLLLSPESNAEAIEVQFFKDHFSDIVHVCHDGEDKKDMQMSAYQGRMELVKDFIVDGHVFLRLKKLTFSDAGLYGCWSSSQTHEQEAI
jgi:hypothetical protein